MSDHVVTLDSRRDNVRDHRARTNDHPFSKPRASRASRASHCYPAIRFGWYDLRFALIVAKVIPDEFVTIGFYLNGIVVASDQFETRNWAFVLIIAMY